jgi:hypothetical protein
VREVGSLWWLKEERGVLESGWIWYRFGWYANIWGSRFMGKLMRNSSFWCEIYKKWCEIFGQFLTPKVRFSWSRLTVVMNICYCTLYWKLGPHNS